VSLLDEVAAKIGTLSADQKRDLIEKVSPVKAKMRFVPLPGPQTEAYLSEADVLLYGGQAGGGKSFLLMGLSSQEHQRSIIFRRESSQTDGLEEAGKADHRRHCQFQRHRQGMELAWHRTLAQAGRDAASGRLEQARRPRTRSVRLR
jgi:hypothetical protein